MQTTLLDTLPRSAPEEAARDGAEAQVDGDEDDEEVEDVAGTLPTSAFSSGVGCVLSVGFVNR